MCAAVCSHSPSRVLSWETHVSCSVGLRSPGFRAEEAGFPFSHRDPSSPLMETRLPPTLSFYTRILFVYHQLGSPSCCTACILPTVRDGLLGPKDGGGGETQAERQEREKLGMIRQGEMWGDNEICEAQVNLKMGALHFQALSRRRAYQPLSRPSPSSQML